MKRRGKSETKLMAWHLESNQEGASASIIFQLANAVPQLSSKQCLLRCPLKLYT